MTQHNTTRGTSILHPNVTRMRHHTQHVTHLLFFLSDSLLNITSIDVHICITAQHTCIASHRISSHFPTALHPCLLQLACLCVRWPRLPLLFRVLVLLLLLVLISLLLGCFLLVLGITGGAHTTQEQDTSYTNNTSAQYRTSYIPYTHATCPRTSSSSPCPPQHSSCSSSSVTSRACHHH